MATLHDSLTIARSAILTHQERMAIISNNIANVNTPGYHRRIALLGSNPPINPTISETRHYDIGTGVRVAGVMQQYNYFQENMLVGQKSDASYYDTLAKGLGDVETLLSGLGDASLTDTLQGFWNSWHDVANNADVLSFRGVLIETGVSLTQQLNVMADRLGEARATVISGTPPNTSGILQDQVDEVNSLATQLAELNSKISYSLSSFEPYDMKDQRTELIRQLSELTDISVGTDYTITIDGETLVSGDGATLNTLAVSDSTSPVSLTLGGNPVSISSGTIGAWIDVASTIDDPGGSLKLRLDTLADTLMNAVNALHTTGYDLDGNAGIAFFTGTDNDGDGLIDADTIAVNSLIYDSSNPMNNDPRLIAAAATRYSAGPPPVPNPEDGAVALQIASLASASQAGLNSMRFHEYLPDALATIGARVDSAATLANEGNDIVNTLLDAIQEETGVNLDEELIEMLSAQRAYQAAARLFTTIDELMEQIIRLGR